MSHYQELQTLKKKTKLSESHSLACLSPYIDSDGLIRVVRWLQRVGLSYNNTHPILFCIHSYIVCLLVEHTHVTALHAGFSNVMAVLAAIYHIPWLKSLMKKISWRYVSCQKAYVRTSQQLMKELPEARLWSARPFSIIGLDNAGPFIVKRGHTQKPVLVKCYVYIYICFTTRACHLELAVNLTTEAFLISMRDLWHTEAFITKSTWTMGQIFWGHIMNYDKSMVC